MQKLLGISTALIALSGCTTNTYIAPEPMTTALPGQVGTAMTTEQLLSKPFNEVWNNIAAYSQDRYRTEKQNKATGDMTLFVDAFDPSSSISCGMLQTQGGGYDTHREFLSTLTERTPVNLNLTVQVKLTAKSAQQTLVTVNTEYNLAVGYQTNPGTGAIEGGSQYRFNSKGFAMVREPGKDFAATCRPTGVIETGILSAAAGR